MTAPNLLERVRKLLAKAEDPGVTAEEAELYNAKAAELIARHGIDAALLAATGATHDEVGHRIIIVENPYARDKAHLLTSVADPLRCQTVHTYGSGRYVVRVYGFTTDLERVELLYTSLLLQATRDLVHVRPDDLGRVDRGLPPLLAGRLRLCRRPPGCTGRSGAPSAEQPSAADGTSTALVLRDRSTLVENAVTCRLPAAAHHAPPRPDRLGRSDGFASGARADLGAHRLDGRRAAAPLKQPR